MYNDVFNVSLIVFQSRLHEPNLITASRRQRSDPFFLIGWGRLTSRTNRRSCTVHNCTRTTVFASVSIYFKFSNAIYLSQFLARYKLVFNNYLRITKKIVFSSFNFVFLKLVYEVYTTKIVWKYTTFTNGIIAYLFLYSLLTLFIYIILNIIIFKILYVFTASYLHIYNILQIPILVTT